MRPTPRPRVCGYRNPMRSGTEGVSSCSLSGHRARHLRWTTGHERGRLQTSSGFMPYALNRRMKQHSAHLLRRVHTVCAGPRNSHRAMNPLNHGIQPDSCGVLSASWRPVPVGGHMVVDGGR